MSSCSCREPDRGGSQLSEHAHPGERAVADHRRKARLEPAAQNAQTVYDPAAHAAAFHACVTVGQGQTLRLQKYCVFSDERRHGDTLAAARRAMTGAFGRADELYRAQQDALSAFWENADTTILGDDDTNLSMQFNLYQLFQSAGRDGLWRYQRAFRAMQPFFTLFKLLGYRRWTRAKACWGMGKGCIPIAGRDRLDTAFGRRV